MYLSIMGDRRVGMLQECDDDHPGNKTEKSAPSSPIEINIPVIGELKGRKYMHV